MGNYNISLTKEQEDIFKESVDYVSLKKRHPQKTIRDMVQGIVNSFINSLGINEAELSFNQLDDEGKKEAIKLKRDKDKAV